jgi:hypothetical protein
VPLCTPPRDLPPAVPTAFQGLWRRRLLASEGRIDRETTVYWLQSGRLYADIRIPPGRPDCESLADASPRTLQVLASQQGFAGHLDVDGEVLSWHRWLDYQPPAPVADVGRVHFEDEILIEQGVHASYMEEWVRIDGPHPDRLALRLETEVSLDGTERERAGVLVASGAYFMIAIDRAQPLPAGATLHDLLTAPGASAPEQRAVLDCSIDFGRRQDGRWELSLSTLPFHEGESLATVHGRWSPAGPDFYLQQLEDGRRRRWQVAELGSRFTGFGHAAP